MTNKSCLMFARRNTRTDGFRFNRLRGTATLSLKIFLASAIDSWIFFRCHKLTRTLSDVPVTAVGIGALAMRYRTEMISAISWPACSSRSSERGLEVFRPSRNYLATSCRSTGRDIKVHIRLSLPFFPAATHFGPHSWEFQARFLC